MAVCINQTRGRLVARRVALAETPWARMKGLLGRPGLGNGEGLLIRPCRQVHTFFMGFRLDVVFLDGQGEVRAVVRDLRPNRVSRFYLSARAALELPAGGAEGVEVGDRLIFQTGEVG